MDYTEFRSSIEERLAVLADTDHNRKKKRIEADLNECLKQIKTNKDGLEKALAAEQYDEAVTIKETIARLDSKSALLKETFDQLDKIPVYSDTDLKALSWETTNFFKLEIAENLKNRLDILRQLDDNDQSTKKIIESYEEIKKSIDNKTTNKNYDNSYCCGSSYYFESVNDMYKLEDMIEYLEKEVKQKQENPQ